ncbi:glycosyltransferase family A protein [Bosea sp. 117]|uniref:glycosyltransferase family 2 protein n=1 Tax=Bosea sp. 117 TaxID=1125973 RepID=UPI0004940C18|nr:glycosyltransferase family A protein [Bosea sp. 117]
MSGISVVIPAFNASATILETLASVAAQSLPPDEVILIDDGSTDGTADLVRRSFPSVAVIAQPNAGAAAASNAGVRRARGALIALLDSDDLWPAGRLERQQAALAAAPGLAGVGGHVESFVCPSLGPEEAARFHVPDVPQPSLLSTALLLRREAFDAVGPYAEDLRVGFAIDWMHRAQKAGLGFLTLPDVVLRRRLRPGSLSRRTPARDSGYLEMARRAIARARSAEGRS